MQGPLSTMLLHLRRSTPGMPAPSIPGAGMPGHVRDACDPCMVSCTLEPLCKVVSVPVVAGPGRFTGASSDAIAGFYIEVDSRQRSVVGLRLRS